MRYFLIALQFLTIFPIKVREIKNQDFGRSLRYFPLVGTVIGFVLILSLYILSLILPHIIVSLLILIILIVITGGVHLDGFADTCDGLYSSHLKNKVLEIMRDSRIGVMGAMGLMLILMLKFSLFYSIPPFVLGKALVIMATSGRWLQVVSCYLSSYAQNEGKGRYFIEYAGRRELIQSSIFSLVAAIFVMGSKGIASLMLLTIIMLPIISYIKKRLGGMTGDTLGAVNEVSEVIILFIILLIMGDVK